MARESGRSIGAVAAESYALTLWTYYQSEEAEYFASLVREHEQIRLADMTVRGWIAGTKEIERFRQSWRMRATVSAEPKSLEEMSRDADELRALHESARNRPVS